MKKNNRAAAAIMMHHFPKGRAFYAFLAHITPLIALFLAAGCVSSPGNLPSPVGADPSPGNIADASKAARELAAAQRMVRAGDYSMVIPLLQNIADKFPETRAGREARYFLGITYYQIGGYRNAVDYFQEYLELVPDGQYAALSQEYLAGMSSGGDEIAAAAARLQERLEAVKTPDPIAPEVLADRLKLAELYWKSGRYHEAGAIYEDIIHELPDMEYDATIRQRVERAVDGSFIVLTPEEVERRYAEQEPLLIVNTHTYRSGRFQGWSRNSLRDLYYHVTGQAVNRGDSTLYNVRVIVTIYGFGDMVFDTKAVAVGQIQPGQSRAFSVKFSNFDNIENIMRYECTGEYQL
jgi:tetratricopeptide (TPR) repeat protein